jgi:hypothetical protein
MAAPGHRVAQEGPPPPAPAPADQDGPAQDPGDQQQQQEEPRPPQHAAARPSMVDRLRDRFGPGAPPEPEAPFLPPEPGALARPEDAELLGTDELVARITVQLGQLGELDRARAAERAEVRRAIHHARLLARVIIQLQHRPTGGQPRLADLQLLRDLAADATAWVDAGEAYAATTRALTSRAG